MALVLKDRVLETCTSPGTGTITLLGAVTGYQAFSTVGNGNTCYYAIADQNGANWEVGIGTYSAGTLARTTVLSSSNAGSLTNFSSGSQNVFLTYPSERSVNLSSAALTSGRVAYATTDGLLTDSAGLTYNGASLTISSGASASALIATSTSSGGTALNIQNSGTVNALVGGWLSCIGSGNATDVAIAAYQGALGFATNGANIRMTLDTSGNLGLGGTPSAWNTSNNRAIQILNGYGSISSNNSQGTCDVSNNCYNSTTQATAGWRYINTYFATLYQQINGTHAWYNAASGTAGDLITFTQAMTLDASGQLGIGTTSPATTLDVNGAITALGGNTPGNGGFKMRNMAGTVTPRLTSDGGDGTIIRPGASGAYFAVNNFANSANLLYVTDSGNVGIGVSSPAQPLQVSRNLSGIIASFTNQTSADFQINLTAGVTLLTPSTGILALGTSNTERMRIDSSGNVGIGGTSLGGKFEVFQSTTPSYFRHGSGTYLNITTGAANGTVDLKADATSGAYPPFTFYTGSTERMRITSAGNVGIGTTSPNYQLHVTSTFAVGASGFNQQLSFTNDTIQSLLLGTGYTSLKLNPLGGNVGIGDSSPGQKLVVSSADTERTSINLVNTSSGGGNFNIGAIGSAGWVGGSAGSLVIRDSTAGATRLIIDSSGIFTMGAYGAGAATFSAAGVISSVSDETWKTKDGVPTNTDAMLQKLEPGYWFYNEEKAPTFGQERQLGFYAQNVHEAIGEEAAPTPEEGKPWGYYDRSVLAVSVMSLKNALNTIEELKQRITALENK